jgi:hypothetical protein
MQYSLLSPLLLNTLYQQHRSYTDRCRHHTHTHTHMRARAHTHTHTHTYTVSNTTHAYTHTLSLSMTSLPGAAPTRDTDSFPLDDHLPYLDPARADNADDHHHRGQQGMFPVSLLNLLFSTSVRCTGIRRRTLKLSVLAHGCVSYTYVLQCALLASGSRFVINTPHSLVQGYR